MAGCSNYYVGNENAVPTLAPSPTSGSSGIDLNTGTRESARIGVLNLNTFFPLDIQDRQLQRFLGLIYEPLIQLDVNMKAVGCLASSVSTSDGGITWDVSLKNNVKWHDGASLSVDDVIYTVEYIRLHNTIDSKLIQDIKEIVKKTDTEFSFVLNQADSTFISKITFPIVKKHGEYTVYPCGTGMYSFSRVANTGEYIFTINDQYHGNKPKIKQIIIASFNDLAQLQASDSDIIFIPDATPQNSSIGGMNRFLLEQDLLYCLVPSEQLSANDSASIKIRKATYNAINSMELIKNNLSGLGKQRAIPIPDKTFFWQKDDIFIKEDFYDVTFDNLNLFEKVNITICAPQNNTEMIQVARNCIAQLNSKGANASLIVYDNENELNNMEYSYRITNINIIHNWDFIPIFAENEILSYNTLAIKNAYMKPNETGVTDPDRFAEYMQSQMNKLAEGYFGTVPFIGLYVHYDALLIDQTLNVNYGFTPVSWNPILGFETLY